MRSAPECGYVGCINPCQVFVRNLPTEFLEKDVASLAEEYGPITRVDLVKSSQTKESKGFGFIKFALEEDAQKAVNGLEGKIVLGKKLRVEIARRKGAKHATKEGKVTGHENKDVTSHQNMANATTSNKEGTARTVKEGCEDTTSTTPYVPERVRTAVLFGLPSNISKKQLFKRVRKFGPVLDLELEPPGRMRRPLLPERDIATVVCETKKGAKELVSKADGRTIKGSKVCARFLPGLSIGEGNNAKKLILAVQRLVVRNLPWDTTEADLGEVFVTWGPLTEVKIPQVDVSFFRNGKNVSKKKSRGFGFVQYLSVADACRVVKDHGIVNIKGRPTAVDFVTPSTKGSDEKQQIGKEEAKAADADGGDMTDEEEKSELLLRSHSAHIPKEHNEESDVSNVVQSTELLMHTGSSDEEGSISNTEEKEEGDNDEEDKEEEEEYYNEVQATSQPTEQLKLKTKDANSIRERFSEFGAVAYSLPTLDKQTGLPKGTAFVKYRLKQGIEACLVAASSSRGIQLKGRELVVSKAVDRDQAARINEQSSKPTQVDRRLLYLANEGLLIPDSQAAKETPPGDMDKRARARSEKKQKLKSPIFFINPLRLSIRNISPRVSDDDLRKLCLDAAEKGIAAKLVEPEDEKRHLKAVATPATELTPDRLKIPPVTRTSITRSHLMRDMERKPDKDSGLHPSRGYGFINFTYHVHALATLRYLNNNPMFSHLAKGGSGEKRKQKERGTATSQTSRLIVEFTVEDISKVKLQESRREKQKARGKELSRIGLQPTGVPVVAGTIPGTSTTEGKVKKGRGQRQREKKRKLSTVVKDQEVMEEVSSKKKKKKLDSTLFHKGQRASKGNGHPRQTPQPSLISQPHSRTMKQARKTK